MESKHLASTQTYKQTAQKNTHTHIHTENRVAAATIRVKNSGDGVKQATCIDVAMKAMPLQATSESDQVHSVCSS